MAKTLMEKFESERNRWRDIQDENVAGVEYSRKAMQCLKKC